MRVLLAALLVGSAGLYYLFGQHQQAAAVAEEPPADRLKAVAKGFTRGLEELEEKLQKADTPAAKNGVRAEARELAALTLGKVLKVAEADPKDPIAVDAAAFGLGTLTRFGADGPDLEKLVGLVADHHLGDRRAPDLVSLASQVGPAGEKLVAAAAEKATAKTTKAVGLYYLGTLTGEKADAEADEKRAAGLYAQAVRHLEAAAKTAPDFPLGEETLGKAAEGEIAVFKTLVVGKPAPEVEGTTVDGKKVKLSDYKGKVVLLDFWFTGCPPCRAMIPHERELVAKLKGKPFELVSVSGDGEKEELTRFTEKVPMPWTHWFDGPNGPVARAYRVKAFPTLYLIDGNGVIRKRWVGLPGGDPKATVIDEAVERVLKEVG